MCTWSNKVTKPDPALPHGSIVTAGDCQRLLGMHCQGPELPLTVALHDQHGLVPLPHQHLEDLAVLRPRQESVGFPAHAADGQAWGAHRELPLVPAVPGDGTAAPLRIPEVIPSWHVWHWGHTEHPSWFKAQSSSVRFSPFDTQRKSSILRKHASCTPWEFKNQLHFTGFKDLNFILAKRFLWLKLVYSFFQYFFAHSNKILTVNLNGLCPWYHPYPLLSKWIIETKNKKRKGIPPPKTQTKRILPCITFRELDLIPQIWS